MADRGSSYRVFRPEVWSQYVKVFFKKNLVAGSHFKDFSSDVVAGGESITIPSIAEGAAPSDVTTTTGVITEEVISDTRTTLTINQWKAKSLRFTDFQVAQIARQYNLEREYAEKITYELAKKFDTDLLTEARDGLVPQISSSTTALSTTVCRNAMQVLDSNSVPRSEVIWVINSKAFWDLMRSDPIFDASKFGTETPMGTGIVGRLFGIPVLRTMNNPSWGSGGQTNFLLHKRAVAYAIGNISGMNAGPRLQFKPSSEGLYNKLIGDLMYGFKILDTDAGVKIKSS